MAMSAQMAFMGVGLAYITGALVTLGISVAQSIIVLRLSVTARRTIYGLVAVYLLAFWLHEDPRLRAVHEIYTGGVLSQHPIEVLITTARDSFDSLQARQSRTLPEAVREYERRYGRRPPLGFDKWFELAQENHFVLIDEFDTLTQSLVPFLGIHPTIIQERIDSVLALHDDRFGEITFRHNKVNFTESKRGLFEKLMPDATWQKLVPYNLTLLVNEWDEAMVSASFDEVARAVENASDNLFVSSKHSLSSSSSPYPFIETGKQNGWAATAYACSIDSPSRQSTCSRKDLIKSSAFIVNATASKDACADCHLRTNHGLLLSPGNMRVAHDLVPILSASKLSHFNDVLYPSAYYVAVRDGYKSDLDSHWDDKDNKFYWVGRATGGWAAADTWPLMQRQRLVLLTNKTSIQPVQLLEEVAEGSGQWIPRYSTMAEISPFFETRIAGVVQCEKEVCDAEAAAFAVTEKSLDPPDAAYRHKFVMDIDGNGFSGRYYRLLQSRSAVVKSTILKEWHDDRLIPWVHYIPLSTDYTELPEMARFLAGTTRGLELSERIARESTNWHNRALRDIDLRLVWLRLMLEYGRIMSPDVTM